MLFLPYVARRPPASAGPAQLSFGRPPHRGRASIPPSCSTAMAHRRLPTNRRYKRRLDFITRFRLIEGAMPGRADK